MAIPVSQDSQSERGSVFLYILIGVVLLAALSYAIASSLRGNSSGVSQQQSQMLASDIIATGNRLTEAVTRMRLRDTAKTALSFENDMVIGYVNALCTTNSCKVFSPEGGGLTWEEAPVGSQISAYNWGYTGDISITDVGSASAELIAVLPYLTLETCQQINQLLSITAAGAAPPAILTLTAVSRFTGVYDSAPRVVSLAALRGKTAACIKPVSTSGTIFLGLPTNVYIYYQVLMSQ